MRQEPVNKDKSTDDLKNTLYRPHDAFFKKWLGNPRLAADFVVNFFPQEVVNLLDLGTLAPQKDSFVSPDLIRSHSDLLYKTRLLDSDNPAYVYLLFEHKSSTDKTVIFQLLRYIVRIWEKYDGKEPFKLILPLVFYHGNEHWNSATNMHQLLETIPFDLKRYIPNFEYLLVNVHDISFDKASLENTLVFELLKAIKPPASDKAIARLAGLMINLSRVTEDTELLYAILKYLHEHDLETETYETLTKKLVDEGIAMPTLKERYRQQGREEAQQEERQSIATQMKQAGVPASQISLYTKLTPQQIEQL